MRSVEEKRKSFQDEEEEYREGGEVVGYASVVGTYRSDFQVHGTHRDTLN